MIAARFLCLTHSAPSLDVSLEVEKFWQAFKDYKHGRNQRLKQAESQLFALLDKSPQV